MVLTLGALLVLLSSPMCEGFGMSRVTLPLKASSASRSVSVSPAAGRRMGGAAGGLRMQVWSNEQAVQEYKDYLSGDAPEATVDGPAVIVGGNGRIGSFLREKGMGEDIVVGRGGDIPIEMPNVGVEFPVYVCVPEDEVESVIRSCPKEKVDDLVFVQGGNIEMLLKKYGLCGNENTQAVLNFNIMSVGARPQNLLVDMGPDSFGETKYAGETVICGKWADALLARLERAGIVGKKLFHRDWRRHMMERMVFQSVVHLVGTLHDGVSIGEVGKFYPGEVEDMIYQINGALRGSLALTLLYGVEERFFALAENSNIEWMPTKVENFKWRNGVIYAISKQAMDIGFDDPCSMHSEYLQYGKDKGWITCDLEPYNPYGTS
eukprot:CAMPEP_0169443170 /NCGR_PEP_ID=MMETSP1042-20121227/9215_1 /TAXON_ID=464988 /ORGANISM="Hemiselmis andersenii, Strain CCMP1180" /LENGTH=376 /DNA_ID=CAMNT_0009554385 /DNA_START=57 /DNA_END=1187 /DNA_ORIENTATION=-